MEWAPAEWFEQLQGVVEHNESEQQVNPKRALFPVEEQPPTPKKAKVREVQVQDERAFAPLFKTNMNSQQKIRKVESCMEYSLLIPIQQQCVQAVVKQMRQYNENVLGVGAPHVHAWIALLQALSKVEKIEKKDAKVHEDVCRHLVHLTNCFVDRDLAAAYLIRCHLKVNSEPALLKIQVMPEARELVSKVTHLLGKYCQATIHYGPAPKGPMERQAQETLDKYMKENKDE